MRRLYSFVAIIYSALVSTFGLATETNNEDYKSEQSFNCEDECIDALEANLDIDFAPNNSDIIEHPFERD